jgi:CheY-like chemotaxis protein
VPPICPVIGPLPSPHPPLKSLLRPRYVFAKSARLALIAAQTNRAAISVTVQAPNLRPMPIPILVIDDSKAVRLIALKALAPFDCAVHEATNGFTGLFALERTEAKLLVIDVSMPTMDGLEMLTMLKSHPDLRKIPVIMLVSATDHKVLPKITELGVNGIVKKPFTPAALIEAIQAAIPLRAKTTA